MKKQVMFTLLAVLTLSILPGCGKSKNDGVVVGGGGIGVPGPGIAQVFTASGTLRLSATSAVDGYLNAGGGNTGGVLYSRDNGIGDRIDLYLAGSAPPIGYAPVPATVYVYMSQQSIDAFMALCGSGPVRAEFGTDGHTGQVVYNIPVSPGRLSMSIKLRAANGCWGIF